MNKPTWIWYFGDFEIHRRLVTDTQRLEGNLFRPAPWREDDCWHNVIFLNSYDLKEKTTFKVTIDGIGSVRVDGKYYSTSEPITLEAGYYRDVRVEAANLYGLPAIFIEGDVICSDDTWTCSYDALDYTPVGYWNFDSLDYPPSKYELPTREIPLEKLPCDTGLLFDAGKETFSKVEIKSNGESDTIIYYGESMEEVLDDEPNMWIKLSPDKHIFEDARAFRYIRIVTENKIEDVKAYYEYQPIEVRGSFNSSSEKLNKIWDVSAYTLELNSRDFFLDGIKRDRYVWSGDAYQSYLLDYYLYFDKEIFKRTTIALRGHDPMGRHINTIMDYTHYWILGLRDYYLYTGDLSFIERMYDKIESTIEFCMGRTEENGFMNPRRGDWVFIDWSEYLDKEGPVCLEQILYAKSLETITKFGKLLNKDVEKYEKASEDIKAKIQKFYWNEEKGAFIDSFVSGKENVSRQANIFAVRFNIADEEQTKKILKNVFENDEVGPITTPYFKFYELESLCEMGKLDDAMENIFSYWGAMLDLGATSFWEAYDPEKSGTEHYGMYGKKYDMSLCHAWGASSIYLLGKYFLGVRPTDDGYSKYIVKPSLGGLDFIEGDVPAENGNIHVYMDKEKVEILSEIDGGTLEIGEKTFIINKNEKLTVSY